MIFVGADVESVMTRTLTPSAIDRLTAGDLKDPAPPASRLRSSPAEKKVLKYRRRVAGGGPVVRRSLGQFPAHPIAAAREWAAKLNESVEAREDPRGDAAWLWERTLGTGEIDSFQTDRAMRLRFEARLRRIKDITASWAELG